ncbi:MAG TPA: DegV family protein [Anaerolineae bacterium]
MVKIITDTTAGLAADTVKRYDIPVIPQIIHFDNDSFLEGIDIDNAGFMQRLKTAHHLPKTAAPPPELFTQQFQKLIATSDSVICIHPTSELSGTVRSALAAKAEFPNADIRIIDTRVIGSPMATMVTLAAEWAASGTSADEIESRIRAMIPRCHVYFLVATLDFLARGGRIGGASALLGGMLQIKPILVLHDGKIDLLERERTQKHAVQRLMELTTQHIARGNDGYLSIMHAAVPDQARELAVELCKRLGIKEAPILDVPPAIVVHGGPGILGVAFFS